MHTTGIIFILADVNEKKFFQKSISIVFLAHAIILWKGFANRWDLCNKMMNVFITRKI